MFGDHGFDAIRFDKNLLDGFRLKTSQYFAALIRLGRLSMRFGQIDSDAKSDGGCKKNRCGGRSHASVGVSF